MGTVDDLTGQRPSVLGGGVASGLRKTPKDTGESTAVPTGVTSGKRAGLARVMSPRAAFMYNILTMGLIIPWTYLWAPQAFPGGSLWLGCLVATLIQLPIAASYVWLTTTMPRSGGDYVFQSRVLGGGIGYTVVMSGFVIWIMQWFSLAGWLLSDLGIAPLLLGLGVYFGSSDMIRLGLWFQSTTAVVIVTLSCMVLATVLLCSGFRNYVRAQYIMFSALIVALFIMLVQFLRTSVEDFTVKIDSFAESLNGQPAFYTSLLQDVQSAGFDLNPKFSLYATLMIAPIAWTGLQWAGYSVQQGGEIKGARVFKSQMMVIVGAALLGGLFLTVLAWAEERSVGRAFLQAASVSFYRGIEGSAVDAGSLQAFPSVLAIAISISTNPLLVVAISAGFILNAFQIFCNVYIGMTRVMVGMSLDRTLPGWISKISPRFRTPINAHLAYFAVSILWVLAYNYLPNWGLYTLGVTFAGGYVFTFTCLAAALLPYRAKSIYETSPGARYKIAGIPAVTVVGLVGFVLALGIELSFLLEPRFGIRGLVPYLVVGTIIAASALSYRLGQLWQKGKGIDVSEPFLQIPPE